MERACSQSLHWMLILGFILARTSSTSAADDQHHQHHHRRLPRALSGCSDQCGNVTIPFPFGIRPGCSRGPEFLINCTTSTSVGKEPIPYLVMPDDRLVRVINISLEGELRILQPIGRMCHLEEEIPSSLTLPKYLTISDTKNKFFTVGCNALGSFSGTRRAPNISHTDPAKEKTFSLSGICLALCEEIYSAGNDDDSCTGTGCAQAYIPSGMQSFCTQVQTPYEHQTRTFPDDRYRCSFAFFVARGEFAFSSNTSFQQLNHTSHLPVVLNWEIGDNGTCTSAAQNSTNFACKANSICVNWPNMNGWSTGYICRCLPGYEGNPYHPHGCQDIDECKSDPCQIGEACKNLPGNFSCSCPYGREGTGCRNKTMKTTSLKFFLVISTIGIGVILVLLVGTAGSLYWGVKQKKYMKLKDKYFQENGGFLLQLKLASHHGVETTRIFTAEELEKATNNFHDSRVLGRGSYGIVYKGVLPNDKMVAIKKSRISAPSQSEQFVNELVVLSQISHRNVVRLLGCCLESEVPLLVYEFITNGTLSEHIHGERTNRSALGWESRLKIAAETAEALAYLHYSTVLQIIHRDVKAMNILLDDNYTAKVADFGASVLIPLDQTQVVTFVQGTLGYLDPEYLHSNQLTEKSDVYSFGVVLAELLTSKVALSYDRPEPERSLARFFVCAVEEERWDCVLDDHIVSEENIETVRNVAHLAKRCLMLKGEERPTMKEVAVELEALRTKVRHSWGNISVDFRYNSLSLESPSTA